MKTIRQYVGDFIRLSTFCIAFMLSFLFRAVVNPTYILCVGITIAVSRGYLYGAALGVVALFFISIIKRRRQGKQ